MSESNLVFPSGRNVKRVKQDAKRLKKQRGILLNEALNLLATENGIDKPWDKAIEQLKEQSKQPPSHLLDLVLESQRYFRPSGQFLDSLRELTPNYGQAEHASITLDFRDTPEHVFSAFNQHPVYVQCLEMLRKIEDFEIAVIAPNRSFKEPLRPDWNLRVSYDGFTNTGNTLHRDIWQNHLADWLMSFSGSGRLHVMQRLDTPQTSTLHLQHLSDMHSDKTRRLRDLANDLESDADRCLFYCLVAGEVDLRSFNWKQVDLSAVTRTAHEQHYESSKAVYERVGDDSETVAVSYHSLAGAESLSCHIAQLTLRAIREVSYSYDIDHQQVNLKLVDILPEESAPIFGLMR